MQRKIIIGSTALKYHFPDFTRTPKDLDYVVENPREFKREKGVEYLTNPILLKYETGDYINPDLLLTLKVSHLFYDINWDKHIYDVQFLIRKGCKFNYEIFKEFGEYWKDLLPRIRKSDLSMGKGDFFTNAINKNEDEHDYLHTLLNPVPMYTRILADDKEVELDEAKFHALSFEDKKAVVFEETAVMAFERYKSTHYKIAYLKQLKDNIIKHFPEYIALFAIFNYVELHQTKINYIKQIQNGLQEIE